MNYKKLFLKIFIVALSISALIGISILLSGDVGQSETRIFLTTIMIGGYSLAGLCSSAIHNIKGYKIFASLGMILSVLNALIAVAGVWEVISFGDHPKGITNFMIIQVAIAHISLLHVVQAKRDGVKVIRALTIACIVIITLMLVGLILADAEPGDFFLRILGVFAILDVLGTVTTPVMNRMT